MATRQDVEIYSIAMEHATKLAVRDLERIWAQLDLSNPEAVRNLLLEVMPGLVAKYGELAASEALDWYMLMRAETEGLPRYRGVVARVPDAKTIRENVRFSAGSLWDGDPKALRDALAASLDKWIKDTGRKTVELNAKRDPAKPLFARVPRGAKTCAWCTMLASRGWVYASSASAESASHSHCDCAIVPSFGKGSKIAKIQGYNPEKLKQMCSAAEAELRADGVKVSPKTITQRMRDMFQDQLTDSSGLPSILRDPEAGWPADRFVISPSTFDRHIIYRHGPNGATKSKILGGKASRYEIAKMIRDTLSDPEAVLDHPKLDSVSYYREYDGHVFLVAVSERNDGKWKVNTALEPQGEAPTMREWQAWKRRNEP